MSNLASKFRDKVSKSKDSGMSSEGSAGVGYPTGFLGLDYLNGTVVHVKGAKNGREFKYNSIGILDGSATTAIGRPGCGKTTLLVQIGYNIIRPFKTACMFHDDLEGGSTDRRREILTKANGEELADRYIYRNSGITSENFYERIKIIHDMKLENRTDYEYDTGTFDCVGNRIYKLEPTVYLLDSIPMLMPKDLMEEDTIGGQMSVTSSAKKNTQVFKLISQMIKEANIILLCINHILDDIQINPMQRKKSQLGYLKQGERLTGGKAAIYLANNMFRIDDNAKLKSEEAFGIDGNIVELQMLKSRTNKSGKSIPMVFDQERGFDPDLSLFIMLKSAGKVNGGGTGMYLGDRSDMKFSQKQFKDKLKSNPELQLLFAQECYILLEALLSNDEDEDISDLIDIPSNTNDLILKMGYVDL